MTGEKTSLTHFAALMAVLVTVLLSGVNSVQLRAAEAKPTLSQKQLKELIASAKEPADHRKLAAYYRGEAQRLRRKAKEHKEMEELYANVPAGAESKRPMTTHGVPHCEHWADLDLQAAKEAEALASMHEEMAKAAEQK